MADSILDAINDGIAEAGGPSATKEAPADEETVVQAGSESAGDNDAESTNAADDAGSDADASGTEDELPAGDDAEDKASKGEPGDDDEAAKEAAAADKAPKAGDKKPDEAAVEQKPKDFINDPIDQRLKGATKERIEGLIEIAKTASAERDQFKTDFNELMGVIRESQASPEQYGSALTYLKQVNSGDPAQMEQALNTMLGEVQFLARALGKPVPGIDLLAEFPDLKQQVATRQITPQAANELAGSRLRNRTMQAITQGTQNAEQQRQAEQETLTKAKNDLNDLETTLKRADTNYAAKREIVVPILNAAIAAGLPPSKWKEAFSAAYARVKLPAAPKPTPKDAAVPRNQPMRAGNPAGGQQHAPKSALEAMNSIDFSRIR